jgi:hypothetical protein
MFAKASLNKHLFNIRRNYTKPFISAIEPYQIIVEHKIFQVGPVALSPKAFVSMKI